MPRTDMVKSQNYPDLLQVSTLVSYQKLYFQLQSLQESGVLRHRLGVTVQSDEGADSSVSFYGRKLDREPHRIFFCFAIAWTLEHWRQSGDPWMAGEVPESTLRPPTPLITEGNNLVLALGLNRIANWGSNEDAQAAE